MVLRPVAGNQEPDNSGADPDQCRDPECPMPAVVIDDVADDRRSGGCAGAHAGEDDAIRQAAFLIRNPGGDQTVGRRENAGFAGAQQKPHHQQKHHGRTTGWKASRQ